MNTSNLPSLGGDSAKLSIKDDLFGLKPLAEAISNAITTRLPTDGYAIGIEGAWGSGKTTLLNFLAEELKTRGGTEHEVIRFEPWLVGHRDALIRELLSEINKSIRNVENTSSSKFKFDEKIQIIFKQIHEDIEKYSERLSTLALAGSHLAKTDPTLFGKISAILLEKGAKHLKEMGKEKSLEETKKKIVSNLKNLHELLPDFRITILIDDTDRLEATDAFEILRLIKSVTNFPFTSHISHLTSHISHLTSHISHLTSHISHLTSHISHHLF